MRERLNVGTGGWVVYRSDDADLWLRCEDRDGRLRIVEMWWAPDPPITGERLRTLQLGRIEAAINRPAVSDDVRAHMRRRRPDLRRALSRGVQGVTSHPVVPRYNVAPRVRVPEKRPYPDSFYRQVADRYLGLQALGESPAQEIRRANGVPLSTANRWIAEARRRGFLPPGRRGKAG